MPDISKRLLVPTLALVAGLALTSCSSDESAAGQQPAAAESAPAEEASDVPMYSVGESMTVDMSEGNSATVTILGIDHPESVEGLSKSFSTPEEGRFVRLDVSWKTEEGVTDAHSTQFALEDPEGAVTLARGIASDVDTLWVDGVAAGEEVRGYVTFDTGTGPQTILLTDPDREDLAHIELSESAADQAAE